MPLPDRTPVPTARPVPPTPSPERLLDVRRQAVAARRTRADIKRRVGSGAMHPAAALDLAFADSDVGRAVARMTVGDLLLSLPGMGPVQADRVLVRLHLNGARRLRALGEHQRAALRAAWATYPGLGGLATDGSATADRDIPDRLGAATRAGADHVADHDGGTDAGRGSA